MHNAEMGEESIVETSYYGVSTGNFLTFVSLKFCLEQTRYNYGNF